MRWTRSAERDLVRIHGFLEPVDARAATAAVRTVLKGVKQLALHPRLGKRLSQFEPRDVRRLIAGDYEIRYELRDDELFVLRVWNVHEDR